MRVRVVLDHCVPRRFARLLVGHDVRVARQMGWDNLTNGALLAKAASEFDVLVTIDKNLMRQQNRGDLPLPVIVLDAIGNAFEFVEPFAPAVLKHLGQPLQRRVYVVQR